VSTGARLRVHPSILQALEAGPTAPGAPPPSALLQGLEPSARTPRRTALADWRAADTFDRMDRVGDITTPTLVLVGEADQLTPLKYARFLSERIKDARLATLPGAGHSLPTEQPARVAQLTAAFLAELAPPGGAVPGRRS
jgi:pimeloyl-ACP methyl ester carboxylesterase